MSDVGVLHPVRIRVVQILVLGPRTGTQLRSALPDVPYSSLYRHVRWLTEAGFVRVTGERKVRGAVEHTYELDESAVRAGMTDPATLSPEEHQRAVTGFLAGLLAQAGAYLGEAPRDPVADGLTYMVAPLWVDEDELARIHRGLRELFDPLVRNQPGNGRRQLTLGVMTVPHPPTE